MTALSHGAHKNPDHDYLADAIVQLILADSGLHSFTLVLPSAYLSQAARVHLHCMSVSWLHSHGNCQQVGPLHLHLFQAAHLSYPGLGRVVISPLCNGSLLHTACGCCGHSAHDTVSTAELGHSDRRWRESGWGVLWQAGRRLCLGVLTVALNGTAAYAVSTGDEDVHPYERATEYCGHACQTSCTEECILADIHRPASPMVLGKLWMSGNSDYQRSAQLAGLAVMHPSSV